MRRALDSADVDALRALLAPDARWGPGESPDSGCSNRAQILEWYAAGRAAGGRATVTEVVVADGRLLVGLRVTGPGDEENGDAVERWQVHTVHDGRVVDIRGYDDRPAAAAAAGLASC